PAVVLDAVRHHAARVVALRDADGGLADVEGLAPLIDDAAARVEADPGAAERVARFLEETDDEDERRYAANALRSLGGRVADEHRGMLDAAVEPDLHRE
ncbi:MAG: hypothetical protein ABMB14_37795, partial [Myxococcota bacterium]